MTNEEREMDLALADLEVEVRRLKKVVRIGKRNDLSGRP